MTHGVIDCLHTTVLCIVLYNLFTCLHFLYLPAHPVYVCFVSLPRLSGVIDGLRHLEQRAKVDVCYF